MVNQKDPCINEQHSTFSNDEIFNQEQNIPAKKPPKVEVSDTSGDYNPAKEVMLMSLVGNKSNQCDNGSQKDDNNQGISGSAAVYNKQLADSVQQMNKVSFNNTQAATSVQDQVSDELSLSINENDILGRDRVMSDNIIN